MNRGAFARPARDSAATVLRRQAGLAIYLARLDFITWRAGRSAGLFWTFLAPLSAVLAIWLALDYGLGMRAIAGPDYGRRLAAALAAWLFFQDAVLGATHSISGNPHLVKKIVFPVFLLPVAAVLSRILIHLVVLAFVLSLIWLTGGEAEASLAALPAAVLLLGAFALAAGLLLASLNVVAGDTAAAAGPVLGLLFWLTPIVWPLDNAPEAWRPLIYLNPLAGLLDFYRYAMTGAPLPASPATMLAGAAGFLVIGLVSLAAYRRLRPVFADAL